MRIAFFVLSIVACSSAATTQAAAPHVAAPVTTTSSVTVATTATVAPQETSQVPQVTAPPPPKVVLHLGDSMVGGPNGLSRALESKFKEMGSKFVRDWQEGVSILTFDHEHRLQDLIAKSSPDLIILTLGANDTTVPYPESLASSIRSLANKMSAGGRACYWIAPPTIFKKTTGIVSIIKKNAAPCKVFDPTYMKIARAGDGIHPTNGGGATWADAFFAYFSGTGPATPNEPVIASDTVAAK